MGDKKMRAVQRNHPALRTHCTPVPDGEDVSHTVEQMKHVMSDWGGLGLAACQINITQRIICIKVGGFKQTIINPAIVKEYGGFHTAKEGCLSFGIDTALMVRYKQIILEGFGVDWQPVRFKLKNLAARVVQHEVDHLNGVTIL